VIRALALAGLVLTACSGSSTVDAALKRCPFGDPNAPAQIEVVHLDESTGMVSDTMPGDEVPLNPPPQGGWILLLGVRATNLDGCQMTLTTSFRDVCTGTVIKLDQRPAKLEDLGNGWGRTTLGSFGNLPVCPQVTSERNLHGEPYAVTIDVSDIDGKQASKTLTLTPVCPAGADRCSCECDRNYVVGGACPPGGIDAGVSECGDAGM
jgi:hypothetical protein